MFFHQKDIELFESNIQNLDFKILQNFASSDHLIGLILEIPSDTNHDKFMHGENEPDCINNECILSGKIYDGGSLQYVFNANDISRIRLWFYRITNRKSEDSCTSFHFTIQSTPKYLESTSREKVA